MVVAAAMFDGINPGGLDWLHSRNTAFLLFTGIPDQYSKKLFSLD
jgi:hypothetical protein